MYTGSIVPYIKGVFHVILITHGASTTSGGESYHSMCAVEMPFTRQETIDDALDFFQVLREFGFEQGDTSYRARGFDYVAA